MNWYLDASVIVPLFVTEAGSEAVHSHLGSADNEQILSTFAASEVASAISRRVRKGEVNAEEANRWLNLFDDWAASDAVRLVIEDEDVRRAGEIVRRYETKLLTPDAIHLGLCQRHGLVMVTLDERLAEAAEMLGVKAVVSDVG